MIGLSMSMGGLPPCARSLLYLHMYGNTLTTNADGTREVIDEGFGATPALAKTGQGKQFNGIDQYFIFDKEVNISDGVANVFVTYAFDNGDWGKRVLCSTSGAIFSLQNGDATGQADTDKISVRLNGDYYVVPVVMTHGDFYSVHSSINFTTGELKVSIGGELVHTVDASASVVGKDVRVSHVGARVHQDTFYSGIIKDIAVFKSLEELPTSVIRAVFREPEFAFFVENDTLKSRFFSQAILDEIVASGAVYLLGENESAGTYMGARSYVTNLAMSYREVSVSEYTSGTTAGVNGTTTVIEANKEWLCEYSGASDANRPNLVCTFIEPEFTNVIAIEMEITLDVTNPISLLNFTSNAMSDWGRQPEHVDMVSGIYIISQMFQVYTESGGTNSFFCNLKGVNLVAGDSIRFRIKSMAIVAAAEFTNFVSTVVSNATSIQYGTQQLAWLLDAFGSPIGVAKPREVMGNGSGSIDTRINLGDEDWWCACVVKFDSANAVGVEEGFGNIGTAAIFNIRRSVGGILQATVGNKYSVLQSVYDGLPHAVFIEYLSATAGTGTVRCFLDDPITPVREHVGTVNLSGVADKSLHLLTRSAMGTPLQNTSYVGSFTTDLGQATLEKRTSVMNKLTVEHIA